LGLPDVDGFPTSGATLFRRQCLSMPCKRQQCFPRRPDLWVVTGGLNDAPGVRAGADLTGGVSILVVAGAFAGAWHGLWCGCCLGGLVTINYFMLQLFVSFNSIVTVFAVHLGRQNNPRFGFPSFKSSIRSGTPTFSGGSI
jgi:hypothetical protein